MIENVFSKWFENQGWLERPSPKPVTDSEIRDLIAQVDLLQTAIRDLLKRLEGRGGQSFPVEISDFDPTEAAAEAELREGLRDRGFTDEQIDALVARKDSVIGV